MKLNDKITVSFRNIEWDIDYDSIPNTATVVAPSHYEREFTIEELLDMGVMLIRGSDGEYEVDDDVMYSDETTEVLSDFISDGFGWCHNGFDYDWQLEANV